MQPLQAHKIPMFKASSKKIFDFLSKLIFFFFGKSLCPPYLSNQLVHPQLCRIKGPRSKCIRNRNKMSDERKTTVPTMMGNLLSSKRWNAKEIIYIKYIFPLLDVFFPLAFCPFIHIRGLDYIEIKRVNEQTWSLQRISAAYNKWIRRRMRIHLRIVFYKLVAADKSVCCVCVCAHNKTWKEKSTGRIAAHHFCNVYCSSPSESRCCGSHLLSTLNATQ